MIFYTKPPKKIPYPYVLINLNNPKDGKSYIRKHRDIIKSVIIDSGIEIFRRPDVKEYPEGRIPIRLDRHSGRIT